MIGPSVGEERAHALRGRLRRRDVDAALQTPWRTHGPLVSALFFGLTCVGVATLFAFLALLELPKVAAGVIALTIAGWLIRRERWFGTGVESGLWLSGLFALIFALPGDAKPEALLLFALACAVAGWRMRNALFGAGAGLFVVAYFVERDLEEAAIVVALGVALAALLALRASWQRPSNEWLWIALLVAMPPAAFCADEWTGAADYTLWFAPLAVLFLIAGVRMRHHAPLVAAMISGAIAAYGLHELFEVPEELTLAVCGAALLASSFLIARRLRDRESGLVVTPSSVTAHDDLVEAAVTNVAAPPPAELPDERPRGDGGFGGAGATGSF